MNSRPGKLKPIKNGVGLDKPSGKPPIPMQVPANFNHNRWLGPTPQQ